MQILGILESLKYGNLECSQVFPVMSTEKPIRAWLIHYYKTYCTLVYKLQNRQIFILCSVGLNYAGRRRTTVADILFSSVPLYIKTNFTYVLNKPISQNLQCMVAFPPLSLHPLLTPLFWSTLHYLFVRRPRGWENCEQDRRA